MPWFFMFFSNKSYCKIDLEMLNQFTIFAFIWAYSLRAQYYNLGWQSAQNYIIGNTDIENSFNIYKIINEADSPVSLLSVLSDRINPVPKELIVANTDNLKDEYEGIFQNYLYYFKEHKFIG